MKDRAESRRLRSAAVSERHPDRMVVGGRQRFHDRDLIDQHPLDLADPLQTERRLGQIAAPHLVDRHAKLVRDYLHPQLHHLMGDLEEELVRVDQRVERPLAREQRLGVDKFLVVGRLPRHRLQDCRISPILQLPIAGRRGPLRQSVAARAREPRRRIHERARHRRDAALNGFVEERIVLGRERVGDTQRAGRAKSAERPDGCPCGSPCPGRRPSAVHRRPRRARRRTQSPLTSRRHGRDDRCASSSLPPVPICEEARAPGSPFRAPPGRYNPRHVPAGARTFRARCLSCCTFHSRRPRERPLPRRLRSESRTPPVRRPRVPRATPNRPTICRTRFTRSRVISRCRKGGRGDRRAPSRSTRTARACGSRNAAAPTRVSTRRPSTSC